MAGFCGFDCLAYAQFSSKAACFLPAAPAPNNCRLFVQAGMCYFQRFHALPALSNAVGAYTVFGNGVLADVYPPDQRGLAIGIGAMACVSADSNVALCSVLQLCQRRCLHCP
jgi:hypothetical protein